MKTMKNLFALAFAFVLVVSAVGCQPKPAAGPVTVHVLTMEQAGPTVDEMNAIVAELVKNWASPAGAPGSARTRAPRSPRCPRPRAGCAR